MSEQIDLTDVFVSEKIQVSNEVKMRGKLEFEWTQRPLLRILASIKEKFAVRLSDALG